MRVRNVVCPAIGMTLLAVNVSWAAVVTKYTTQAAFNAAVASTGNVETTIDYTTLTGYTAWQHVNPITVGPVTVRVTMRTAGDGNPNDGLYWVNGLVPSDAEGPITISLNSSSIHSALGVVVPSGWGGTTAVFTGTVGLTDSTTISFTTGISDMFLGYVSTTPGVGISSITFNNKESGVAVAPFFRAVSYSSAAPEPSACVLAGIGLISLAAYALRKWR